MTDGKKSDGKTEDTFYCEDCECFFQTEKGMKIHFKRVHNISIAVERTHKEGCSFCPHLDCIGKPGYVNENKMTYHFQAAHGMKHTNWLCGKKLQEEYNGVWPLCGCGCGQKVSFYKNDFSTYCKGHHHKGKTFPQEVRDNVSKRTQEAIKNVPKEVRINRARIAALARDTDSYANADKSFYSTQEYRDKMSESVSKALAVPEVKKRMLEGQSRWLREKGPNDFEQTVLNVLESIFRKENVTFQFLVDGINHKYDFCVEKHKLIVEAYGSFWHGDLLVYTKDQLESWQNRNRAIDKKYEDLAREKGYKVVTIWENKKDDIEFIRNKISDAIRERQIK